MKIKVRVIFFAGLMVLVCLVFSHAQYIRQIKPECLSCQSDDDCTAGVLCCECWGPINKAHIDELVHIRKECTGSCDKSCRPQNQPASVCVKNQCELNYTLPAKDVSMEQWEKEHRIVVPAELPPVKGYKLEVVGFGDMYGEGLAIDRFPIQITQGFSAVASAGDLSLNSSLAMGLFTKYPYPDLKFDLAASSPMIQLCGFTPQYQCQMNSIKGTSTAQNMPFRIVRSSAIIEAEKILLSLARNEISKEKAVFGLNKLNLAELVKYTDIVGKPFIAAVKPVYKISGTH